MSINGKNPSSTKCPNFESCPMFGLFTMSGTLTVWKDNYCHSDFQRCERYKRSQRGEDVPRRMMPNGKVLQVFGEK